MKNSVLILIWFIVLAALSQGRRNISGRLIDADTREPISGAVVKAIGGKSFTSSKSDGGFSIICETKKLSIRCMGYESIELTVPLRETEILMHRKETVLNEVIVEAPDIFQRGDTLVFSVGKYATAADDAIIDVIKRLPGVKVEKDGTIMYQGKPINKFYIDGNDFVGDAYGLATNNISKEDVAAVEVMENHQPVKALEDIEFSDQAGINLKLKENARSRWVGVANAGIGISPLLYSGSLFAMRLARKMQNIITVKADNTGWNPDSEIKDRSYDQLFSSDYRESLWRDYITADRNASPLAENRTRDNLSWIADVITSWSKGDVSNRLKVDYIGDRLDYSSSDATDYFSPDISDFIQNETLRTRRHSLSAELKTEINRKGYFLKDKVTINGDWWSAGSSVTGSFDLNQEVRRRRISAVNDLRLIRKTDKTLFTLSSRNGFSHNPSSLSVDASYGSPAQHFGINDFRSTTESQFGWFKGFWRIYADGGLDLNYHHLNADLEGLDSTLKIKYSTLVNAFLASVYLSPKAEYERRGWRVTVRTPVQWHHYCLNGNHDFITFRPNVYFQRQLTAKSDLSMHASYSSSAPDASMFVDCAVMSDYRNLFMALPINKNTETVSTSATYRYRNPLIAFFANASLGYSYSRYPYMTNQKFVNDFIITTYEHLSSGAHNVSAKGGISKGLCHSRLVLGMDASYSRLTAKTMRDDIIQGFRHQNISVSPYLKGSLTRWLSMNYALNLNVNSMKIGAQSTTDATSLNQALSFTFIPTDKLNFTFGGEHYYTHFGDKATEDANLILVDASAVWRINDNIRMSLTARNLLDCHDYRYTSFGTLSQTDYRYHIRPRNILLSLQFRF